MNDEVFKCCRKVAYDAAVAQFHSPTTLNFVANHNGSRDAHLEYAMEFDHENIGNELGAKDL